MVEPRISVSSAGGMWPPVSVPTLYSSGTNDYFQIYIFICYNSKSFCSNEVFVLKKKTFFDTVARTILRYFHIVRLSFVD